MEPRRQYVHRFHHPQYRHRRRHHLNSPPHRPEYQHSTGGVCCYCAVVFGRAAQHLTRVSVDLADSAKAGCSIAASLRSCCDSSGIGEPF